MLPLDLHVLGLPLAFILSQDQTLHRCFLNIITTINCLYSKMTYLVLILNYLYHSSHEKCTRCQFNKSMNFPDLTRDILVEIKGLEPLYLSHPPGISFQYFWELVSAVSGCKYTMLFLYLPNLF